MVEAISQEHFSALKQTVVLANRLRLAYVEMGDPDGVPILLLHGFTDSARSWSLTAPYLATGFRVIAPDLRGHGHSDQPEGCYTIPEMANDVRFLIEALDLAPTHVVGHSLGGRLAQAIAERWPHLSEKSFLYRPPPRCANVGGGCGKTSGCSAIRSIQKADSSGNGVLAQYRSTRIFSTMRAVKAPRCRHESGIRSIMSSLPMIRRRSCRISPRRPHPAGKEDMIATEEHQIQMKDAIVGAKFISLSDHGHNIHWEAPERVAHLILTFLERP